MFAVNCLYFFLHFAVSVLCYSVPVPRIELLNPKGLNISIPHERDIVLVGFHLNIDRPIAVNQLGDFSADVTEPTNGRWTYNINRVFVDPTNQINYWIHVQYKNLSYRKLGNATASGISKEKLSPAENENPSRLPSETVYTVNGPSLKCEKSSTTVHHSPVCKGHLIFEDNFDNLNWTKWKPEVRMPLDADDAEFVSYQSRPENCYINSSQLHIVPSLLSELPGFNKSRIRSGRLDLGAECTAIVDIVQECTRKAQFAQILPPVVSARIRTKDFFTFRYGKVEVRAKLPKGDWVFPLILLEPLENYYGFTGYASGAMRVAFIRGNEFLETCNGENISGSRVSGGVVLTTGERLRDLWLKSLRQQSHLGDDFHIYTLTWTDEYIAFALDGNEYANIRGSFFQLHDTDNLHQAGRWNNGHNVAPFDREFYLTLGVSVGGHSDFSDESLNGLEHKQKPWKNMDYRAELNFWRDRENWLRTWKGDQIGLHVDYVRIYAL